jgi:hypothetical protein
MALQTLSFYSEFLADDISVSVNNSLCTRIYERLQELVLTSEFHLNVGTLENCEHQYLVWYSVTYLSTFRRNILSSSPDWNVEEKERGDRLEVLLTNRSRLCRIWVRRLQVTADVAPSSPILVTLMMEALSSSETSVFTRATRRNIPEDDILHSHRRENFKSYITLTGWAL